MSISQRERETGHCLDSGQRSARRSSTRGTRGCKRRRARDSLKAVVGISFLIPLLDAPSCLSASPETSIPLPSTQIHGTQPTLSASSWIQLDSCFRRTWCAGSGKYSFDDAEDEHFSSDCEWDPDPSQICRTCSLSNIRATRAHDRDIQALLRLRSGNTGNEHLPAVVEHNATCSRGNASATSASADPISFPSGYSPSTAPRTGIVAPFATSDAGHEPVPHLSQPLKTLRRLQQMLDATDYVTSSPRNAIGAAESEKNDKLTSVSRAGFTAPRDSQFTAKSAIERIARAPPLAPRNSHVIPPPPPRYPPPNMGQRGQETGSDFVISPIDKLWTSKDKSKYRKQQSKLQRVQEELKQRAMSNISEKSVERSSVFEDDTDDGLGYTLPSLPVYLSDAEDGESDGEDAEPMWHWSQTVNPPIASRSGGSAGLSPPGTAAFGSQNRLPKSAPEYANPDAKGIYHQPTQHHFPPGHQYVYYPTVFPPPEAYHPYNPAYGTVYAPPGYHPQPPYSPYAVYGSGPLREHQGSPSSLNPAPHLRDISLQQPLQNHSPTVAKSSSFHPDSTSSQFHSNATPRFSSNTPRSSQTSGIKSVLVTETETGLHGVESQTMSSPRLSRAAVEFRPLISRMHERDIQKTLPLIFSGAFRQSVPGVAPTSSSSRVSHSRTRSDVMALVS
jgi:hypothetical protein